MAESSKSSRKRKSQASVKTISDTQRNGGFPSRFPAALSLHTLAVHALSGHNMGNGFSALSRDQEAIHG